MTGSLQKKNGKYYAVINIYQNGNRKQKWIDTGFAIKGNKMYTDIWISQERECCRTRCRLKSECKPRGVRQSVRKALQN